MSGPLFRTDFSHTFTPAPYQHPSNTQTISESNGVVGKIIRCSKCRIEFCKVSGKYSNCSDGKSFKDKKGTNHIPSQDGVFEIIHLGNNKMKLNRIGDHDHNEWESDEDEQAYKSL